MFTPACLRHSRSEPSFESKHSPTISRAAIHVSTERIFANRVRELGVGQDFKSLARARLSAEQRAGLLRNWRRSMGCLPTPGHAMPPDVEIARPIAFVPAKAVKAKKRQDDLYSSLLRCASPLPALVASTPAKCGDACSTRRVLYVAKRQEGSVRARRGKVDVWHLHRH